MKLVTFSKTNGEPRLGALVEGGVLDLNAATHGALPASMLGFIEGGERALDWARNAVEEPAPSAVFPLKDLKLKAPLPNPGSLRDFFAFEEHAKAGSKRRGEELAPEWYQLPVFYKGNHREIYGPEDVLPWPYYTRRLDFECEVACVVGGKGRNLSPEEAAKHLFGYMIFNDVSARDIQKKEMVLRMGPAKGKDFANVFGPWLVTADEAGPQDFAMTIRVNGELWSEGRFSDQHWGFPLMLSYISQEETIYPGDVLGSGTFYKGCGLDLERWLKAGDVLELSIPALGTLRNTIGTPSRQEQLDYSKFRPAARVR